MCGIYGVVNKKVDRELAMKCLNTMIHRGPDGYGLWQEDGVTLGHRRLSILDLSNAGSQPMSYANERYWMTFNGEIYNFIEIRDELKKKGYTFRSASDSEVIMLHFVSGVNPVWNASTVCGHLPSGINRQNSFSFPETVLE